MALNLNDGASNIYEKWNWFRNETFIQSVWRDKYAIGGGFSHDYFETKYTGTPNYTNGTNFINSYLFIKSDTQDDKSFPTKGIYLNAEGKILDLLNKEQDGRTLQAKITTQLNFPITPWFTYRLGLFGGLTVGKRLPNYYEYRIGGIFAQNLGNFTPFQGYEFGELSAKNLLTNSNSFQFNVYKNYFIEANLSIANLFNDIKVDDIFHVNASSAGLTLGYKSPLGQIKINYSRSLLFNNNIFSVVMGHYF